MEPGANEMAAKEVIRSHKVHSKSLTWRVYEKVEFKLRESNAKSPQIRWQLSVYSKCRKM